MIVDIDDPIAEVTGERPPTALASVTQVLARGETDVIWDGKRALLGFAAGSAGTAQAAFAIRYSSGFLQIAIPSQVCDRLLIPVTPTLPLRPSVDSCQQCIGVDAVHGVTTGISALDRARTARVLADGRTAPDDISRPGHLVVVAVNPEYRGENAVSRLALQLAAAGHGGLVFADLVSEEHPDAMADDREATQFVLTHGLSLYRLE